MEKKFKKTKFITGMRAYSALAVFLIHSGGGGLRQISNSANSLVDFGKYGVISFFVISAFTIYMSIDNNKLFKFKSYMLRRFFRIAPMYYIILIISFFLGGVPYYLDYFNIQNDLLGLFLHLLFLNIFDIRYMNSLIGVEWSIPIEFFYYLVIPLIFLLIRKHPVRLIYIFFMSFAISFFSKYIFHFLYSPIDKDLANHWSIEKYFFTFVCGICAYMLLKKNNKLKFSSYHIVGLLAILVVFIYMQYPHPEIFMSIWTSVLIIFSTSRSILAKIIFENKLIQYIGEISYSIYLVHFPIINLLPKELSVLNKFIVALILSIIVSSLTYYIIELPFIKFGKKILYQKDISKSNTNVNLRRTNK